MDISKYLNPFELVVDAVKFVVSAYKGWRGFRLVVFGTTGVGKSTFWEYLQSEQIVPEDAVHKTLEVEKFQKFRLRSIRLSFIKVGVLATDLPGDLKFRHTWEQVLQEVKPHGIIFMLDNANITAAEPFPEKGYDPARLEEHKEAFDFLTSLLHRNPEATKKLHAFLVLVNKADTFPASLGGHGKILQLTGIMNSFNSLNSLSEFQDCRMMADSCSALFGTKVQENVKWLVRNM